MNKKIIVSVSGGKDSTASLIKALSQYSKSDVIGVFCDTGWEHPDTYKYIEYLKNKLGVEIIAIKNKKYAGVLDCIRKKHIFPSSRLRFCSSNLKVIPMINFLLEFTKNNMDTEIENWVGIRTDESRNRAQKYAGVSHEDTFPYSDFFKLSKKRINILKNVYLRYPVINLTANEVYKVIVKAGLDINPLYHKGQSRVGCYPCVIGGMKSYKATWNTFFGKVRILQLLALEQELNAQGYKTQLKSNITCQNLVNRLENNDKQLSLFDEDEYVCGFCHI